MAYMTMRYIVFIGLMFLSSIALRAEEIQYGVLDLTNTSLESSRIALNGEWEFYWRKLLEPEEFGPRIKPDYFPFPELWNKGVTVQGDSLDNFGFATYRLLVYLPTERPDIALYIKHVYSASDIWVNGNHVAFGGQVGATKQSSKPQWIPKVIHLPSMPSDTLEIVMQISNFHHRKGGAREPIYLGDEVTLDGNYSEDLFYDLLLTGTLIMTGLFFMGLFFFGQHEYSAIYFSLFCLTFSYRIIGADDYVITVIAPNQNWQLFLRLEYLSLFIPPLFFALYTHALYPFRYKLNPFYLFAAISGVLALVTIFFPVSVFSFLVEPYLAMLLLAIALAAITYVRAYRAQYEGSFYALMSTAVVLAVFIYDILIYVGVTQELEVINFTGYLAFFFFQSLILFFLFTNSLKKAKEQAELAVAAKTEFLSTISHEIRTPLNAVVGISHFLLDDAPRQDQKDNLVSLKYSAEHLTALINDILDYNKLESGFVEFEELDTDLFELVNSIYTSYKPKAENKGIELILEFDPSIKESIITDRTRMIQIINNLTDNAIKFTRKGSVTIRVTKLSATASHKTLRFEVQDTGIGIPKEKQVMVFERFTQASSSTTREFGGTGLGLSIIKRLLELQNIQIKLESAEGKGTKIFFEQEFRIGQQIIKPNEKKDIENGHKLSGKRVLLVEDNEMNILVATQFLTRWGMEIETAKNGREAVARSEDNSYDIILMDLQMPEMDGYTAATEIRGHKNPIPIIALTASALISVQERVFAAGMNDYITKPFDPAELKTKLVKNLKV